MTSFLDPRVWVAIFLAMALAGVPAFLKGRSEGHKLERAEWQAKEIQRKEAEAQAVLANQETTRLAQKANDANARKVAQDHEQALSQISKQLVDARAAVRAAGGLRITVPVGDHFAASTETASYGGRDVGATRTVELPESTQNDLFAFAADADKIVEQARACQEWIKINGFYGEK